MLEENEALRENTAKLERDLKNSEKVVQENENLKKLNNTISGELNKLVRENQQMKEKDVAPEWRWRSSRQLVLWAQRP